MMVRRFAWPLMAAAVVTGGSFLATASLTRHEGAAYGQEPTPVETKQTETPRPETVAAASELSRAFRAVHNSVKDAVVNINTSRKIGGVAELPPRLRGRPGPQIPEELRRHFGIPDVPDFPQTPGHPETIMGTGSGVIVSADGYVLTNNHVVEDAVEITVRLDDGREFKAKTIGRDPKTDIAVVKIDADKLIYAKLGDSDAMEVGDWVLAFGSPFGFEQTMTQGIISAKGRSNVNIIGSSNPALAGLTYENFLQTDAAINPGNSGGPLVNLKGEVVGINTAIASRTGAYNGIGFAIPSSDAKYVMDSLIKNGKIVRGYMGVGIIDVTVPEVRERVKKDGFTGPTGVLVQNIQPDSPGGKGGLKVGDVITAVNGKPVTTINHLRTQVARTAPKSKIDLTVWRDGKTVELSFPVGEQPESAMIAGGAGHEPEVKTPTFDSAELGLSVKGLDEAGAKKYGLSDKKGVMVAELDDSGMAAQTGVQVGDVILSVNRQAVASPEEFAAAVKKANLKDGIRLTVRAMDGSDRLVYIEKK